MACSNNISCPCAATDCPRFGKCCECIKHHKSNGNLPICFFSDGYRETGKTKTIEDLYYDYMDHK
jgi:hypothetical protein